MRLGEGERRPLDLVSGEGERLLREGDLRLRGGGLPEGERRLDERSDAEFSFSITEAFEVVLLPSTKKKHIYTLNITLIKWQI